MPDWKGQLGAVKRKIERENAVTLKLPATFAFKDHDLIDFNRTLSFFNWNLENRPVRIEFEACQSANYQALSLLIPYVWHLRSKGCKVSFGLANGPGGASRMWRNIGGLGAFNVAINQNENFRSHEHKPLVALRNSTDFKAALRKVESFTDSFDVEYQNTLRYVLSELMYNTLEHGATNFSHNGRRLRTPSAIQFTWYETRGELHFIIADTGVGIKKHLEQTYPAFESDAEAIRAAIRPQVSGTFALNNPYEQKNNAGVGLFISTNIVRRLQAEMHIVSGDGVLHVSGRDITETTLNHRWPGTFVLVQVRIDNAVTFALESMMREFREAASSEISKKQDAINKNTLYLSIENYFGPNAEDKQMAIGIRDRRLMPAVGNAQKIVLDFEHVKNAPHSFLSALLATPIKVMGIAAYKRLKVVNASSDVRETIDFILDENTDDV